MSLCINNFVSKQHIGDFKVFKKKKTILFIKRSHHQRTIKELLMFKSVLKSPLDLL